MQNLGIPIPNNTKHAVSVTLPTWEANIGYEEGDQNVHQNYAVDTLDSQLARKLTHRLQLSQIFEKRFAKSTETCFIFPCRRVAQECRDFINKYFTFANGKPTTRIAEYTINPPSECSNPSLSVDPSLALTSPVPLFIVLFPTDAFSVAKQFWQHTGEGISSRFAEHCLKTIAINQSDQNLSMDSIARNKDNQSEYVLRKSYNKHYSDSKLSDRRNFKVDEAMKELGLGVENERDVFVEERFGRNMDVKEADKAKLKLKKRIAGVEGDENADNDLHIKEGAGRGVANLDENDVYLFPTGMSAIYNAFRVISKRSPGLKSIQFGFPYLDTLKIQEKFGPGCYFYGHGDDGDLEKIEKFLESTSEKVSALFCEFPSNPLLKAPDLRKLRVLANKFKFIIVVDETIGNFVNVSVLEHADIVVSSLTKVFSGDSNVMGGSAILNPLAPFYTELKTIMNEMYKDNLWCEDAIFLERNSRNYEYRIDKINKNAEFICDLLRNSPKVENIYYPKYVTPEIYKSHMRVPLPNTKSPPPGFGGLFSILFKSEEEAARFFDSLDIAKGPSLGTNFTLACPYTILAHYTELEWAESFGVPRRLIRISVGMEDRGKLVDVFQNALNTV
ncbi:hypothetical protein HK098_005117 [Nowakowskiella sp. JEL0407]|nr:hypothetical protein HK098_005117 [Nowakowskiella sp. JEL0407]